MPFVSEAQRRKFYATPSLRKYIPEYEAATSGKLPDRVGNKNADLHKAAVAHMKRKYGTD